MNNSTEDGPELEILKRIAFYADLTWKEFQDKHKFDKYKASRLRLGKQSLTIKKIKDLCKEYDLNFTYIIEPKEKK